MGTSRKKRDEYDLIYNHSTENEFIDEIFENDSIEEKIEKLKGNISRGDCLYCNSNNTMEYEGHICFICSKCGNAVHEDIYYRWAAGCTIKFED